MHFQTPQAYGLSSKDFYKDGLFYGNLSDRPRTHEADEATAYAQEAFRRITHNVSDVLSYVRFSTAGKGKEKVGLHYTRYGLYGTGSKGQYQNFQGVSHKSKYKPYILYTTNRGCT